MFQRTGWAIILVSFLLVSIAACTPFGGSAGAPSRIQRAPVEGGDIEQGRQLLRDYGCGACHTIPGVEGADAHVGPPLTNWTQRSYVSGTLPNTLDNLVIWIMNPQQIDADTAMPALGVGEQEALDMSAYLYSLGN